jgi:beta-glucosidase
MVFPNGFLWGASTSAHQVEGNNLASDWWAREHGDLDGAAPVAMPSGDAADSYHRYREDMRLLADAGLTAYRFSIEWARIEPERGSFSLAALAHYRRMIDACRDLGLEPLVTLHHFTNPAWFTREIGWGDPRSVDFFGRYVQHVLPILGDVDLVGTINEPNMVATVLHDPGLEFAQGIPEGHPDVTEHLISAHQLAVALLRMTGKKAGWSVATLAVQAEPGFEDEADEYARSRQDTFLDASSGDDWVGVQAYTRTRVGEGGMLSPADDAELTQTGWEFYPEALELGVRRAWERSGGLPVYVTENGIATADDSRRIAYTRGALEGLERAIDDGVDVRSYLHWSALDNYEWGTFEPTFGLIRWRRDTFERQAKQSLGWLGDVARRNGLPA